MYLSYLYLKQVNLEKRSPFRCRNCVLPYKKNVRCCTAWLRCGNFVSGKVEKTAWQKLGHGAYRKGIFFGGLTFHFMGQVFQNTGSYSIHIYIYLFIYVYIFSMPTCWIHAHLFSLDGRTLWCARFFSILGQAGWLKGLPWGCKRS